MEQNNKIPYILALIIVTSIILGIQIARLPQQTEVNQTQIVNLGGEKDILYKININNAPLEELISLQGIGKTKAEAIILSRDKKPFKNKYELLSRELVGEEVMEKIKDRVEVK